MKRDKCAEFAWFSGGKVTSVSLLRRGSSAPAGRVSPLPRLPYPVPPAGAGPGCSISTGGRRSCTLLHQSVLASALFFPSTALYCCWREIPAGFLGLEDAGPTQGFRRGTWTEQGELCCGYYVSASCSGLSAPRVHGLLFWCAETAAQCLQLGLLIERSPVGTHVMLGAVVWLSSASLCSRAVLFCKHP